jgi:cobyrinic acid a,c-diamide synthase
VLDEYHGSADIATAVRDEVDAIHDARRLEGGVLAIAEGLLNVDDKQGWGPGCIGNNVGKGRCAVLYRATSSGG